MLRIVFLCTGNSCRSPMAEGICREMAKGEPIEVASAGIAAPAGMPASAEAREVCRAAGIDISIHRTRPLTPEIIAGADLLLAMETHHREAARRAAPERAGRVLLLSEFAGAPEARGVSDPFGAGVAQYERTFAEIRALLERAWPRIKALAAENP